MFVIIGALCLFSCGSTSAHAARPKDAYSAEAFAAEAGWATVSLHHRAEDVHADFADSEAAGLGTVSVQNSTGAWLSPSAERNGVAALMEGVAQQWSKAATRTKLHADYAGCKGMAKLLKDQDYAKKETWTTLKERIKPLSDEGIMKGKWKSVGEKIALLETAAQEMTALLTNIVESTAGAIDDEIVATTKVLVHKYINTWNSFGFEKVSKMTGPMLAIHGLARTAVTKAWSKTKYAKHFEEFYIHLGVMVPEDVAYGRKMTPAVIMAQVMAPIAHLVDDLKTTHDDVSDATFYWKSFAEKCVPDDDDFKEDEDDAWTIKNGQYTYAETGEDTDCGQYMTDINYALQVLLPLPALPSPGWTAAAP
eukprot:CAMPEP_0178437702 /NCGR_PEP_ID=MMETSP0689_2-20121128/35154_1 /TAXON_ID=160604 /ORGANISM="Amphidinium massartii, Strain CS-259" /LENGTH=364 /DNA_ID=CAMNT_0020059963 /DNA_START=92 /DNA_END=1186 /DNA_ORIENTATION=+